LDDHRGASTVPATDVAAANVEGGEEEEERDIECGNDWDDRQGALALFFISIYYSSKKERKKERKKL
jgi:hypothetical protein